MAEATKRSVCTALGCDYDKCDWRSDGYSGGGGGYVSGNGYSDKYKHYDGVYVDLTPKVDYYKEKKIIEVVEEEVVEEKEEKTLTEYISSKVEGYQEESASYDEECDEVSYFFSDLSLRGHVICSEKMSNQCPPLLYRMQKHSAVVRRQAPSKNKSLSAS